MHQGKKQTSTTLRRLPWLALAIALSALSVTSAMTSEVAIESPAPSTSQCALIEVHDTAAIGWWSSAAQEIDPAPADNGGE